MTIKHLFAVSISAIFITSCENNSDFYKADKDEISDLQSSFCACAKDEFKYIESEDWKLVITNCDDRILYNKHKWFVEAELKMREKYPDSSMTVIDWKIAQAVVYNALNFCPHLTSRPLTDVDEFMKEYRKSKEQAVESEYSDKVKMGEYIVNRASNDLLRGTVTEIGINFDDPKLFKTALPDLTALQETLQKIDSCEALIEKRTSADDLIQSTILFTDQNMKPIARVVFSINVNTVFPKVVGYEIFSLTN